jgi:hypothetical protein
MGAMPEADRRVVPTLCLAATLTFVSVAVRSAFSSPSFCSASVAYWGFRGKELVPTIYDLRRRSATATQSFGTVTLETDNTGVLPEPTWNTNCSEVSFDGAPVERPVVRLKAPSR